MQAMETEHADQGLRDTREAGEEGFRGGVEEQAPVHAREREVQDAPAQGKEAPMIFLNYIKLLLSYNYLKHLILHKQQIH